MSYLLHLILCHGKEGYMDCHVFSIYSNKRILIIAPLTTLHAYHTILKQLDYFSTLDTKSPLDAFLLSSKIVHCIFEGLAM